MGQLASEEGLIYPSNSRIEPCVGLVQCVALITTLVAIPKFIVTLAQEDVYYVAHLSVVSQIQMESGRRVAKITSQPAAFSSAWISVSFMLPLDCLIATRLTGEPIR